jgi:homocysteine S-methyltransferase
LTTTPDLLGPFLGPDAGCVLIIDGAMATELERRGAHIDDPLWSAKVLLKTPALIRDLHRDYFQAGADVAITASYQASFEGFSDRGLDTRQSEALFRLSVQMADEAREEFLANSPGGMGRARPMVAASIGPFGAHLHDGSEYHGRYEATDRAIADFHRRRIEVLLNTAADLLAIETIPSLREGELLMRVLEEFPGALAWLSYSCRDGRTVSHGESFACAVGVTEGSNQIVAVGVNCTPPQYVPSLLNAAQGRTSLPLLAYPNSGECWIPEDNSWAPGQTVDSLADAALIWRESGARLIGGCCRTGVADIAALARALRP